MPLDFKQSVRMAEIAVAKEGVLTCLGLGSCIGVCAFDPISNIGGMMHVMLPSAFSDKESDKPGKFADTGMQEMLRLMEKAGANRKDMLFAIAGGAQVFSFGSNSKLDIGPRNGDAVREQLAKHDLKLVAKDIGGSHGRTVMFNVETGDVIVRTISKQEVVLCNLRQNTGKLSQAA